MQSKKRDWKKRRIGVVLIVLAAALAGLWIWTKAGEASAHRMPEEEKISIESILDQQIWEPEDFKILTGQTGLSKEALVYMKEQGRQKELLLLQEAYFRPVGVECIPNSVISREEYVVDELGRPAKGMVIPYVEEGDILITNCSHVFGWRNGHAAIVVDADRRLVLEAQVLGSPSVIVSMNHWELYPSFMVLRLREAGREERAAIAKYAEEFLTGVPYHVTAGILERVGLRKAVAHENEEENSGQDPGGTHCAHLVWYVYLRFGYDLDSSGGLIVTPRDLANSKEVKVIQKYGI